MKAVIVDINRKNAVALCKNGEFIKLKNKYNYNVGNEIDVPAAKVVNLYSFTKIASIAAMFLLIVGLGFGMYTYSKPYSYIDIDINPSIEVTTNVFNRVILIKGLNKDGEKVIESGKYKNKNIEACIKIVLDSAVKNGYLITEKNNAVLFTVSSHDEEKTVQIEKVVNNSAQKELKEIKVVTEVITEKVSIKRHDEAKKTGISVGKLKLIEKLQKVDPKVKVEDYKDAPVKKIIMEIQEGAKTEDSDKDKSEISDKQSNTDKNKEIKNDDQKDKKEDQIDKKEDQKDKKQDQKDKKEEEKIKNEIEKKGKDTTTKKQPNTQKSKGNKSNIKNNDNNNNKEISNSDRKNEGGQKDSKDQKENEKTKNKKLNNKTEKQKDGDIREETKDKPKDKSKN